MSKEKEGKLTQLGLESYYQKLGRSARGKLGLYVASYLEISYASVQGKFTGKHKFSKAELIALQSVIDDELWMQ